MKNAHVRIGSFTVNPGLPIIEREPSTYEDVIDEETKKPKKDEEGNKIRGAEILWKIKKSTKTYNVNIDLDFLNEEKEGIYEKEQVSINGLLEDELNFKSLYKKLKNLTEFSEAKDS